MAVFNWNRKRYSVGYQHVAWGRLWWWNFKIGKKWYSFNLTFEPEGAPED